MYSILVLFSNIYTYIYKYITKQARIIDIYHFKDELYYAHYGSINKFNYWFNFNFIFRTHPIRVVIKAGESVVIPKYWWHWIRSYDCTAINFWIFDDNNLPKTPTIIYDSYENEHLLEIINKYDGYLNIWNVDNETTCNRKLSEINNKFNNHIITILGYNLHDNNALTPNIDFKNYILPHIHTPSIIKDFQCDKNIWICNKYNDSGLHYDNYDGILTVLKGTKYITFYPPSDSIFIKPKKIIPYWAEQRSIKFEYNLYVNIGILPESDLSSARLLYETLKTVNNFKIIQLINCIIDRIGCGKIIWGFKKKGDEIRWELYFYHYNQLNNKFPSELDNTFIGIESKSREIYYKNLDKHNIQIHSFDIYNDSNLIGNDIHLYYTNKLDVQTNGYSEYINKENIHIKEGLFIIDTVVNFKNNYNKYTESIQLYNVDKFKSILDNYKCTHICIWNKYDSCIFIQYLNISINDFIHFLKKFKYDKSIIKHVIQNKKRYSSINHEITIVYNIDTMEAIRSGFYGLV